MSKKGRVKAEKVVTNIAPKPEEVTEQPEPVEEVVEEPVEEPVETKKSPKNLEKELLKMFNETLGQAISIKFFADKLGATEFDVAQAWHSLFDKKKVPYPDLPRGY